MVLVMMLKPEPLLVKKKAEPKQILKGLEEYAKVFKEFLEAMVVAENHANPEVSNSPCPAFKKVKKCHRVSYNNK